MPVLALDGITHLISIGYAIQRQTYDTQYLWRQGDRKEMWNVSEQKDTQKEKNRIQKKKIHVNLINFKSSGKKTVNSKYHSKGDGQ